jgi:hypothetical protein
MRAPPVMAQAAQPPPTTPQELERIAAVLEDTADFVAALRANHVKCDASIAWHGQMVSVADKMQQTCAPWKQGDQLWQRAHLWMPANTSCGAMGTEPANEYGYCTVCPAPYDTTEQILRDDALQLRLMAGALSCATAQLAAQQKAKAQDDAQAAALAKEKAAADAQTQASAQHDAAQRDQWTDEERRQHQQEADEQAARNDEERTAEENREQDAAIVRDTEARHDADTQAANQQGQALATGLALINGGSTNDPGRSRVNRLSRFGAGMAFLVVPVYSDSNNKTSGDEAFGVGVGIDYAFMAIATSWFSAGVRAHGVLGGAFLPSLSSLVFDIRGDAAMSVGPEGYIALLARVGAGWRAGTSSAQVAVNLPEVTASFDQTYAESAIGAHFCIGRFDDSAFCKTSLDVWYVAHDSDVFAHNPGTPSLLEIDVDPKGDWGGTLLIGNEYPSSNLPTHPTADGGGLYFMAMLRFYTSDTYTPW